MALVAKEKVWRTYKNKLVADGDPEAAQLIARKGQLVEASDLRHYPNADDFFVEHDSRAGEAAQRPVEEKRKAWSRKDIEDYRSAAAEERATDKVHEPKGRQPDRRLAPAEVQRRKRPGPEKAAKKPAKKAAAKE